MATNKQPTNGRAIRVVIVLAFCILLLAPRLWQGATLAQAVPDPRFGAVEAFRDPDSARDLNLGWDRILFYWSELQRNGPNDEWNIFHVEDGWLSMAAADGRQVIGVLENTPAWATDGPPQIGVPRGLYLPIDDPNNLWASFVRTAVRRYKGRIDHWVIWNEPDIEPPDDGIQWDGTVADYYQLVKVAYQVAKRENPNAVIHLAGLTYHHDVVHKRVPYLQRFINEARKDPTASAHNDYFDVATFHVYLTTDSVYDIMQILYGILRRSGLKQPIWINETNSPPSSDPLNPWRAPTFITSLDQQADFIVDAFALGLAAGAQRIAVYKLVDYPAYPPGFPGFGLVRADGTHRPAYDAMKVVTRYFRDVRTAKLTRTGSTDVVTLDRGPQTTRIAWSRGSSDTGITLQSFAPGGLLVAVDGSTQPITAVNGQYKLTLPAAKCDDPKYGCRLGGRPIILVEGAPTNFAAAGTIQARTVTPTTASVCADCTSTSSVKIVPSATACADCTPTSIPTSEAQTAIAPGPANASIPAATPTFTPALGPGSAPNAPLPGGTLATATAQPTAVMIAQVKAPLPAEPVVSAGSTDSPAGLVALGLGIGLVLIVAMVRARQARK